MSENDPKPSVESTTVNNAYYWYNGTKIAVTENSNKKFVIFEESSLAKVKNVITRASSESLVTNEIILSGIHPVSTQSELSSDENTKLVWANVDDTNLQFTRSIQDDIIYEAPHFISPDGIELGISHLFYVKLKHKEDEPILLKVASEYGANIVGYNEFMPLWYTLSCTNASKGNALQLANVFYETNLFAAAQPDFMSQEPAIRSNQEGEFISEFTITRAPESSPCVNDPGFPAQWNLQNTGQYGSAGIDIQFCDARNITQGRNTVIVAVFDTGVKRDHVDINIHSLSYDAETDKSPSKTYQWHGTACAGIISAKTNNGKGIAGIAPNCPIMSISRPMHLASTVNDGQKYANGINYAWKNGASVISNSWGIRGWMNSLLEDALIDAITKGRSGKGCVVVFAAGNSGTSNPSIDYPCTMHWDLIPVANLTPAGIMEPSSGRGTYLDCAAPGEKIATTAYDTKNADAYIDWFNGTSAAAPHVAGISALVLSINPNLTARQVNDIIERSCTKVGPYYYTSMGSGSLRPNGGWCSQLGYGLVSAYKAVQLAQQTL